MTEELKPKTTKKKTTTTKAKTKATPKKAEKTVEELALELAKDLAKEMAKELMKEQNETIQELKSELKEAKKAPRKQERLDGETYVPVRSMVTGKLGYKTREGIPYTWSEFGSVQELTVAELRFMRAAKPSYFTKGWIFIEDEEVVKELRLDDLYTEVAGNLDLESLILNKSEKEIERVIENSPKGIGTSIGHFALKLIREKKLSDYNKINTIQSLTGLQLKLYMD